MLDIFLTLLLSWINDYERPEHKDLKLKKITNLFSFFNCCFHLLMNCLFLLANGVLRHCTSAAAVSSSNFWRSLIALNLLWYFCSAGKSDKWWQCNVKNQHIVEKFGGWCSWAFPKTKRVHSMLVTNNHIKILIEEIFRHIHWIRKDMTNYNVANFDKITWKIFTKFFDPICYFLGRELEPCIIRYIYKCFGMERIHEIHFI